MNSQNTSYIARALSPICIDYIEPFSFLIQQTMQLNDVAAVVSNSTIERLGGTSRLLSHVQRRRVNTNTKFIQLFRSVHAVQFQNYFASWSSHTSERVRQHQYS